MSPGGILALVLLVGVVLIVGIVAWPPGDE
jgi:hypothetical protein